jgi:hypothetical protein
VFYKHKKWSGFVTSAPSFIAWIFWKEHFSVQALFPNPNGLASTLQQGYSFVWNGISEGIMSLVLVSSPNILVFIFYLMLLSSFRQKDELWNSALIFAWAGLIFYLILAYSRQGLGVGQSYAPRYTYVFVLTVIPILALGLNRFRIKSSLNHFVAMGLGIALVFLGTLQMALDSRNYFDRSFQNRIEVNAAWIILSRNQPVFMGSLVNHTNSSQLIVEDLYRFNSIGGINLSKANPSPIDLLAQSVQIQTKQFPKENTTGSFKNLCKNSQALDQKNMQLFEILNGELPVNFSLKSDSQIVYSKKYDFTNPSYIEVLGDDLLPISNVASCPMLP